MTGKVIKFEVPERVRHVYVEPDDLLVEMDVFEDNQAIMMEIETDNKGATSSPENCQMEVERICLPIFLPSKWMAIRH